MRCVWLACAVFICLVDRTKPSKSPVYTNQIAVEIHGGPAEADRVAHRHGFINRGQVCVHVFSIVYVPCTFRNLILLSLMCALTCGIHWRATLL